MGVYLLLYRLLHTREHTFRACSVVLERAQEPFLLMMVIQINKAIQLGIYPRGHSIATEHALRLVFGLVLIRWI